MEYKLYVQRIEPISTEEKEEMARKKNCNNYDPSPMGIGCSSDTRLVPVLDVILTEEEYNRAKKSIINDIS